MRIPRRSGTGRTDQRSAEAASVPAHAGTISGHHHLRSNQEIPALDVPVEDITRFEKEFFDYLDTKHPEIPAAIAEEKVISDATEEKLVKALNDFKAEFLK